MKNTLSIGKYALIVLLTPAIFSPSHASAQVLDQQINALLANNCELLGTGGPPVPSPAVLAGFGPNLRTLCDTPITGGASSAGGGAASLQGSTASILNRTVLGRLEELRQEDRDESTRPSAFRFNPLGLMAMAGTGALNVSSPFYAASAISGGSGTSVVMNSPSRWKGLGFFASGLVESLNRDVTTFQDGYKSRIFGASAGVDYRITRRFVLGLVGNFSNTDGDFRTGGGTFSTNSYGGLAFAQILPTDKTFIQITGGYTRNNYLIARLATAQIGGTVPPRTVNSFASSNSNGDVASGGLLAGYDHHIGRYLIGPRVGVNYTQTLIGSYAEDGGGGIGLRYDAQTIHSLQSTAGIQASTVYSTGFGVLVHQINADYVHEFANSQRHIAVQFTEDLRTTPTRFAFQNEAPVRNYAYVGTGLVAVLPNGWQPFINFRAMVGNSQFDNYTGTFGLRIEL